MSVVVFWDLDGTLLTTNRGGVAALEDACESALGQRVDLSTMRTAGLTDREIASVIVSNFLGGPSPEVERTFLSDYAEALPARLQQVRGHVMPNVVSVLEACAERTDVEIGLLTGNVERCAYAKLISYGIDPTLFAFGGFAEDGHTRVEIGAAALGRSGGRHAWADAFLVGDTPSDVEAGRVLELKTIAVATGGFSRAELAETSPWTVVAQLPESSAFLALMGVA